jgi:hypothetical protein
VTALSTESAFFVALELRIHALATHAELARHLGAAESISKDAEHGVISLFHFADVL